MLLAIATKEKTRAPMAAHAALALAARGLPGERAHPAKSAVTCSRERRGRPPAASSASRCRGRCAARTCSSKASISPGAWARGSASARSCSRSAKRPALPRDGRAPPGPARRARPRLARRRLVSRGHARRDSRRRRWSSELSARQSPGARPRRRARTVGSPAQSRRVQQHALRGRHGERLVGRAVEIVSDAAARRPPRGERGSGACARSRAEPPAAPLAAAREHPEGCDAVSRVRRARGVQREAEARRVGSARDPAFDDELGVPGGGATTAR